MALTADRDTAAPLGLSEQRYQDFSAFIERRPSLTLAPASRQTLDKIQIVHEALLQVADVEVTTEHVLHGGMYIRTLRREAGIVSVGSLIKLPTILIVNGSASVWAGDGWTELEGYNVIPGHAWRKQIFVTRGPVEMTMIFATQAKTVEEAENEVFAEADALISRKDGSRDTTIITGV